MKSLTDQHWDERALSVKDDVEVNIMDVFQRHFEYDYITPHLKPDMVLLEVGCGNGYSTAKLRSFVKHIDAFDYAEHMIERARSTVGETNNRFIHDNVLAPRHLAGPYDAVLCVRVLINLRNLEEQRLAVRNLTGLVKPGGLLILAEGFADGFEQLTALREKVGLPPVVPAAINYYSRMDELQPLLEAHFDVEDQFHLGAYDYLTRVMYPLIVGPDEARHNTVFSERCYHLARHYNPDAFAQFSRMRGLILRRRGPRAPSSGRGGAK